MYSSIVESLLVDSRYGALAGWLCLVASLFFAFRRPAANIFLTLPFVGMGGVPLIGVYTYARISALVGFLTVLVLVLRERQRGAVPFAALVRTPLTWFVGVCVVISVKIGCETIIYGLDAARTANLLMGLFTMLFPSVVLLLSEMCAGPEPSARDMLVGMFTFPVLMMAGYVPYALEQDLLGSAWRGLGQFTIGAADPINSAIVFTYGAIASVLVLALRRKPGQAAVVAACVLPIAAGFIVLLLLSGTRQYLLALAGFLLLWAFVLHTSSTWRLLASIVVVATMGVLFSNLVIIQNFVLKERVSPAMLASEARDSRGVIWLNALKTVLEHPVLGAGFKNFGEEVDAFDRSGNSVVSRDSAHGVWQDVFTEHGIPLGIAFLVGCIHLVVRSWQAIRRERRATVEKMLTIGFLAVLLAMLFSNVFLNATPVYLLLVMAMARDGRGSPRAVAPSWRNVAMGAKEPRSCPMAEVSRSPSHPR